MILEEKLNGYFYRVALFGALIIPPVFFIYSYKPYEFPKIIFFYGFASLMAILLAWKFKVFGRVKINKKAVIAWLVFFLLNFISALFAKDKILAFFNERYIESILFYFAAFFWLLGFFQIEKSCWRKIFNLLVWQSGFISVISLAQVFLRIGTYNDYLHPVLIRPESTFGTASYLAVYLTFSILCCIYLFLDFQSNFKKIFYASVAVLDIWGLVMAGSRASWLSFGIVIASLIFIFAMKAVRAKDRRRHAVYVFAFAVIFAALFSIFGLLSRSDRQTNIFSSEDVNISSRLDVWQMAIGAIIRHPLLGVGPNNFTLYYEAHRTSALAAVGGYFDQAHNILLQIALDGGILALGAFLYFLWLVIKPLKKYFWNLEVWLGDNVDLFALLSFASIIIAAMFGPLDITSWFFIILFASIILSNDLQDLNLPEKYRHLMVLPGILGGICILLLIPYIISDQYFLKGMQDYKLGQYSQSYVLLSRAIILNPLEPQYYIYRNADYVKQNSALDKQSLKWLSRLQPNFSGTYQVKASAELFVCAKSKNQNQNQNRNLQQGFADYEKAMQLDKLDPQLMTEYAGWLAYFGYYGKSENLLLQSLALNASQNQAYILLAEDYDAENNFSKRDEILKKAYLTDPLNFIQLKHFLDREKQYGPEHFYLKFQEDLSI